MSDEELNSLLEKKEQHRREHFPETLEDGFRPRKKRPAGWLKQAIADGSVRDPNVTDPDAGKDYSGAEVVRAPLATIDGSGSEE